MKITKALTSHWELTLLTPRWRRECQNHWSAHLYCAPCQQNVTKAHLRMPTAQVRASQRSREQWNILQRAPSPSLREFSDTKRDASKIRYSLLSQLKQTITFDNFNFSFTSFYLTGWWSSNLLFISRQGSGSFKYTNVVLEITFLKLIYSLSCILLFSFVKLKVLSVRMIISISTYEDSVMSHIHIPYVFLVKLGLSSQVSRLSTLRPAVILSILWKQDKVHG